MNIELSPVNARGAAGRIKKRRPRSVRLTAAASLFPLRGGLGALRAAADLCIAEGIALEIPDMAPCVLPGYARYLRRAAACVPCPAASACMFVKVCAGVPARYAGLEAFFKPPVRGFTDLEKCMLAVLPRGKGVSTEQVLRAAKKIKICSSCSTEGEVFRAAERLIKLGLVAKEFRGGAYIWRKN